MKFETKCKKLGIEDEVKSIIENCECGEINNIYLIELSKLRKWEIMETIGNYIDPQEKETKWWNIKQLKTFCNVFEFSEDKVSEWYARAISEDGYCIGYEVNGDVVLVIE